MIPNRCRPSKPGWGARVAYFLEFDPVNRILCCRMEGQVTEAEFVEYYGEAVELAAQLQPRAWITDLCGVTSFEVSSRAISDQAGQPPVLSDPSAPRVVIARSPSLFGVARMFQLRGQQTRPNLHVVHTHAEAWEILGLKQAPHFDPIKK